MTVSFAERPRGGSRREGLFPAACGEDAGGPFQHRPVGKRHPQPDSSLKGREIRLLHGAPPSPANPLSGCRFRTRCPCAKERRAAEEPALRETDGVQIACHFAEDLKSL